MLIVPAATPVTTPVAESIVALAVLLLLQVPAVAVLLKVVCAPTHTFKVPDIEGTAPFTVTCVVLLQPAPATLYRRC